VPSNKRQKELARRRAERQVARREQEKARRRKRRLVGALAVVGVAAAVFGIILLVGALTGGDDKKKDEPKATACGGKTFDPIPSPASFGKDEPKMTIDPKKKYTMTIVTSCGPLVVALDAKNAPHTVNSFAFLAEKNFYDGSPCHRMNDAETFAFLQCGDPTGTGSGQAPGYTIAEENTKGAKYTRGTLAMANTGQPHSTGSQFFLLAKDSTLPPNYTVAGHVTSGIENLDKIIALGTDGAFEPSPGGGHPNQPVYLEDVTVAPES
jgi:cyclophilin family peptidyl-prolyl cis-trans isomerase